MGGDSPRTFVTENYAMKYLFLLALSMTATTVMFSQATGHITFEEKMDLHKTLPPDRQDMKDMIPQFNVSVSELIYKGDESIYRPRVEEEITPAVPSTGGPPQSMRFGRPMRTVYKNLSWEKMIDSRDFMQKQFLITGSPTVRAWKIGTKQKVILGYHCIEANFREDSTTFITAWFAPELAVFNGPADYQGLPGMILLVDVNDGVRQIVATEIKLDSVDTSIIQAPTKGKEVTAEEFEKIREEKMKEMGMQGNAPGGQRMFIMHN